MKDNLTWFLIYFTLLQMVLYNSACTTYYSTRQDNNLKNYSEHKGKILLKLIDGTEINSHKEGIRLIEYNKIDSLRILNIGSEHYQFYWLKNKKRLRFKLVEDLDSKVRSDENFWMIMDENANGFRKIYNSDIQEIFIQKSNYLLTGSIIALVFIVIIVCGIISPHNFLPLN